MDVLNSRRNVPVSRSTAGLATGWLDVLASERFPKFREDGCIVFTFEPFGETVAGPGGEDVFLDPATKRPGRGSEG
jgi:hypothetical protein